jgi:chromosomal replication initiation ATPase DnaA
MAELQGPVDPFARFRHPTINDIIDATAKTFQLPRRALIGQSRSRSIARPRQVAMYLARRRTTRSLPEIGRVFGGRDHSTVVWAIKQIANLIETDPDLVCSLVLVDEMAKDIAKDIAAIRFAKIKPGLSAFFGDERCHAIS